MLFVDTQYVIDTLTERLDVDAMDLTCVIFVITSNAIAIHTFIYFVNFVLVIAIGKLQS